MAYILIGDRPYRHIVNEAAEHLRERGHEVETSSKGKRLLELFIQRQPDIMAFSFSLYDLDGWDIIKELQPHYTTRKTQYIWIAIISEVGTPAFSWQPSMFSNVLLQPYSAWDLVLCIEQLIYRRVTPL